MYNICIVLLKYTRASIFLILHILFVLIKLHRFLQVVFNFIFFLFTLK